MVQKIVEISGADHNITREDHVLSKYNTIYGNPVLMLLRHWNAWYTWLCIVRERLSRSPRRIGILDHLWDISCHLLSAGHFQCQNPQIGNRGEHFSPQTMGNLRARCSVWSLAECSSFLVARGFLQDKIFVNQPLAKHFHYFIAFCRDFNYLASEHRV